MKNNLSIHSLPKGRKTAAFAFVVCWLATNSLQASSESQATPKIQSDETNKNASKPPGDPLITLAIEDALFFDVSVPENDISVAAHEGIVTLSGIVPNLIAKDRARMIAESIRGVRSVIDKITLKPMEREDSDINDDVQVALQVDPATDSYEVKSSVADGVVTLNGNVDSWQEKQLAESVVKGVKGIKKVINDIAIDVKLERPDAEIAADVAATLRRDIWVDDLYIDMKVNDGKVVLTGTVGSVAEKKRASADAWTMGTKSVDNSGLNVEPWAQVDDQMRKKVQASDISDDELKNAVKSAFLYDPRLVGFNPDIYVRNGMVTLAGSVDSAKAKGAAEQDARNTFGVWRVKNRLRVRVENEVPDEMVAKHLRDALSRDPYVERYKIGVIVINGIVYLHGTVDSTFEKVLAEEVASRVNGVKSVRNNLNVDRSDLGYYAWPYETYDYLPYYHQYSPGVWTGGGLEDLEVKEDIESEFFWSPFVDGDDITVTVVNGTATLTGTVDDWSEYYDAAENAHEGGARIVVNNLKVK